jgi:hypothetical protein
MRDTLPRKGAKWRVIGVILGGVLSALAMPNPAYADHLTSLRSAAADSPKCVVPRDGDAVNGAPLVLADCYGDPAASFSWFGNNDRSVRNAVDWPDTKCVGLADRGSTVNGTALILWDCHLNPDQRWQFQRLANGAYAWVNGPSRKCVGLANRGSTANGTPLVLWDCHLNPDQRWRLDARPYVYGLTEVGNI